MLLSIAIEIGSKATDCIGDVRASRDSQVVEAADKLPIGCPCSPGGNMGGDRQRLVRSFKVCTDYHGDINRVSIQHIELLKDVINESSLRY